MQQEGWIFRAMRGRPSQSLRRETQNDPVEFLPEEAVLFLGEVRPSYHHAKRIYGGMQMEEFAKSCMVQSGCVAMRILVPIRPMVLE